MDRYSACGVRACKPPEYVRPEQREKDSVMSVYILKEISHAEAIDRLEMHTGRRYLVLS